jgi:hypothetical protein
MPDGLCGQRDAPGCDQANTCLRTREDWCGMHHMGTMRSLCQQKVSGSDGPLVAGFRCMALVALHRLCQRTCLDCGYHWTVTRRQEQMRVRQPVLRQRGVENSRGAFVVRQEGVMDPRKECAECGGVLGSPTGPSRNDVQPTPRPDRAYRPGRLEGGSLRH